MGIKVKCNDCNKELHPETDLFCILCYAKIIFDNIDLIKEIKYLKEKLQELEIGNKVLLEEIKRLKDNE